MIDYTYYPGCSAHATGRAYDESTRAIAGPLGVELHELDDWNCCGATAYMSVNETLSFALTARNLALAEKAGRPVCTACSACYLNLRKTNAYLGQYGELRDKVTASLAEAGLAYGGAVETRHLLEVVARDVGFARVRELVQKPLTGLRLAPYYGCQILRPFSVDENPDNPQMLEQLIETMGAEPTPFALKSHCCGGMLMSTQPKVALRLCRNLLLSAQAGGAEWIVVTCPLCQINLDTYQKRINKIFGTHFAFPVLYFTQLLGLALGLPAEKLGLSRGIVPVKERTFAPAPTAPEVSA